jgi:hypothetical protein
MKRPTGLAQYLLVGAAVLLLLALLLFGPGAGLVGVLFGPSASSPGPIVTGSASASPAASDSASKIAATTPGTEVAVTNATDKDAVVYFAFGSNSVVNAATFSAFCSPTTGLVCSFPLKARGSRFLPLAGKYLNATITFNAPVGCGATKAELNVNNPQWYDVMDVSLVDGFSNELLIDIVPPRKPGDAGPADVKLFPRGKSDNEKAFGVFPFGCDVCVERQNPPCGISKGKDGCKGGTQYKPDVPCQYQGPTMNGGGKVDVVLVQPVPAL